jgi:Cyclic nucleotide-binding domain
VAINASLPLVAGGASSAPATVARGLPSSPASDAAWVEVLRRAALGVFPAVIVSCVLVPWLAGRIFWTIAIASLPLFFVVAGYHRWRRICPLAAFAQLPARFGFGGRRRAGPWMQQHFYHVSFGMLLFSLWLRLVATNGDGYALAVFLVALALLALLTDSIFTGKTWCNYVCPISFVEKIYTEPRNLRPTVNSQCEKCTACKSSCPDINQENTYWKEVLLPAKRHVYFAFPGVVFTFYFYYFLQAGTWEYYFGGRWTHEIGLVRTAFLPGVDAHTAGLYFLPGVPRAIAAAATLALGALVSFSVFATIERVVGPWLIKTGRAADKASVRHVMFTLAAFTAFLTFYSYAGAPTLRLVPSLPHFFQLLVVTTASLFLMRRLLRRQTGFVEETLARQIIAKWPWKDTPAPHDLREAFIIHRVRSQSHEEARTRALQLYKDAVRDTVNSGIVSRGEIHRLEAIRDQMHISQTDHERIMAELAEEDLATPATLVVSPEKQLQLETYGQALAAQLARQRSSSLPLDDAVVRGLREEYAVTEEEHAAVLDRLVRRDEGIAAHLFDVPMAIEMACVAMEHLEKLTTPAARFLTFLLQRRSERMADSLLSTVSVNATDYTDIRAGLVSHSRAERSAALEKVGARVSSAVSEKLTSAPIMVRNEADSHPQLSYCLRRSAMCPDPYVRAAALYLLESIDEATDEDYAALEHDDFAVVREIATRGRHRLAGHTDQIEPTEIAKMIGLKAVQMFDALEPEDLALLAKESRESWFGPDEVLFREGEMGDEVFVLLSGEVSVLRRDDTVDRVVAVEGPGSVIGELAVLDPAPRNATVIAGFAGAQTMRLCGSSFRRAMSASPAVSEVIIRMLARRVRAQDPSAKPAADPSLQRR